MDNEPNNPETMNQANEPRGAFYNPPLTFNEVWQLFIDTDKKFQDTDKKIKELSSLFTSQWGRLIESLVEGDLVKLLRDRNIPVEKTLQRIKGNNQGTSYEFDIIAVNGNEIVIVEVKTTIRPDDVKLFTEKLRNARVWMNEYKDKIIYGAVAYLTDDSGSGRMAENLGLFVIKATGSSAAIVNCETFIPRGY